MLSEKILMERAGNFSASENHKLMAGWDAPQPEPLPESQLPLYEYIKPRYLDGERSFLVADMKKVMPSASAALITQVKQIIKSEEPSTGLVTYAQEKALEELSTPDPSTNFSTVHTRNGEEREITCMELLADETGLEFVNTGDNQAHSQSGGVGCTPDGLVLDNLDLPITGAEVKCKSILVHGRLLLINNNDDLKEEAFDHFVQIQTQMLVTATKYWYFAIYNPFYKESKLQFRYIKIYRDDGFIKILQERIDVAKAIKAEFLNKFNPLRTVENLPEPANEPVITTKLVMEI